MGESPDLQKLVSLESLDLVSMDLWIEEQFDSQVGQQETSYFAVRIMVIKIKRMPS